MSIKIIDTIAPLGDFPAVDSTNVQVGNKRLNVAISEKSDVSYVNSSLALKADKTYVDTELLKKANAETLSTKADLSAVNDLSSKVSSVETEQEALNSRMDEFTTLTEGSTTGDAELADGRIGSDGTTYTNIGGAIRGQVNNLKSDINNSTSHINVIGKMTSGGWVRPADGVIENNSDYYYSDYIKINSTDRNYVGVNLFSICYFDENKKHISSPNPGVAAKYVTVLPPTVAYVRISCWNGHYNTGICGWYNAEESIFDSSVVQYNIDFIANKQRETYDYKNVMILDTEHYYYDLNNGVISKYYTTGSYYCYKPILLDAGVYTYSNMGGYFAFVSDNINGTNAYRVSNDTTNSSGTITINKKQYLWIALWVDYVDTVSITASSLKSEIANAKVNYLMEVKNEKVIYCGASREYTTLKSALEEAVKTKGCKVYVDPGTYDIISEFGDTYFASVDDSTEKAGIQLYNDVHIIFADNAFVKCNWTGSNGYVNRFFSPFNSGDETKSGGYIVENLNIVASNVRYIFHDEHVNDPVPYVTKYINCIMSLDNTNTVNWTAAPCIGGGLGGYAHIEIRDCVFSSKYPTNTPYTVKVGASYHQTRYIEDAYSKIVVTDSYVKDDGTFGFYSYGDGAWMSQCLVSNCSVGHAIDDSVYEGWQKNMEVIEWNNEIRN